MDIKNIKNEKTEREIGVPKIPIIENIHQRILEAVKSSDDAFDMSTWHTCDTTHCRAGWVTHLAGADGKRLELLTSTSFAAMQIYHASCPQIPVMCTEFYKTNEISMADIERCAAEEKALIKV